MIAADVPSSTHRALVVSAVLERELGLLMRHLGRNTATVDATAIAAVEGHRRVTIPDDVLAYLAASGEPLHGLVDHDEALEAFFRANGSQGWKSRTRFAHVSFTAWGDWPRTHAAFDQAGDLFFFSLKTATLEPAAWPSILRRRWPDVDFDAGGDARCAAVVRLAVAPKARTVVHPRFGRGRVVADEEGKLRIHFEGGGEKTLLARFVTDVLDEEA